jgi:hypothetical protein
MLTADEIRAKLAQLGATPIGRAVPPEFGSLVQLVARGDRLLAHTDNGSWVIVYDPAWEEDL